MLLVLLSLLFLGNAQVVHEIGHVDCKGGMHMSKPNSNFFDAGFDGSMIKRALEAGLDIVHEHVKCKCNGISQAELNRHFTPSFEMLFRATNLFSTIPATRVASCGTAPPNFWEENPVPSNNIIQPDEFVSNLLNEALFSNASAPLVLPTTCDLNTWTTFGTCGFQIKLDMIPEDAGLGTNNVFYFKAHRCDNSAFWPYMSFGASGDLFDHVMKPCSSDNDCGSLKCHEAANSTQVDDIINTTFFELDFYKESPTCSSFANTGTVFKRIQNELMNFISHEMFAGGPYTNGGLKFCGVEFDGGDDDEQSLTIGRHREILKRKMSDIANTDFAKYFGNSKLPLSEYLQDAVGNVQKFFKKSPSTASRKILQTPTAPNTAPNSPPPSTAPNSPPSAAPTWTYSPTMYPTDWPTMYPTMYPEEEEGDEFTWEMVQEGITNYTQAWHPSFTSGIVDGSTLWTKFKPGFDGRSQNRLNMFHLTCDDSPAANFMGGISKSFRGYAPKFPSLIKEVLDMMQAFITTCRTPLASLTNEQFWTRFIMADPLFAMNLFTDNTGFTPGAAGYDPNSMIAADMNLTDILNGGSQIKMPTTCTMAHMLSTGKCEFEYTNIAPLLGNADVKIALSAERCPLNPHFFSVDIDCVGTGCYGQFDVFSVPCSTDSDCPAQSTCQIFSVCDPFGVMWNSSGFDDENDGFGENENAPVGTDPCKANSDTCTNTAAFRKSIVEAMLAINGDTTTQASTHTGMCMPKVISNDESVTQAWEDDLITNLPNGDVLIKGFSPYAPPPPTATLTYSPTKAPSKAPTVQGYTYSPTYAPTRSPTNTPTKKPTNSPTIPGYTYPPSFYPTTSPTIPPVSPTDAPTTSPTIPPTSPPSTPSPTTLTIPDSGSSHLASSSIILLTSYLLSLTL